MFLPPVLRKGSSQRCNAGNTDPTTPGSICSIANMNGGSRRPRPRNVPGREDESKINTKSEIAELLFPMNSYYYIHSVLSIAQVPSPVD